MKNIFIILFAGIKNAFKAKGAEEEACPVCGYYCLGNGGVYCIDKPSLVAIEKEEKVREV